MENVQQPNFRDLCSRLSDELHNETCLYPGYARESVIEAQKALKQPATSLTREEIMCLYNEHKCSCEGMDEVGFENAVKAILARFGHEVR